MDRNGVLAAAAELYRQRNHSQVVAACRSELSADPENVDLRLLTARSLMALRRDAEAQVEVSTVLKLRPKCPDAYQLLGELAFRRDELRAAEIFLREAIRLRAEDAHSKTLLEIIGAMAKPGVRSKNMPSAAPAKLPAAGAAAGAFLTAQEQPEPLPPAPIFPESSSKMEAVRAGSPSPAELLSFEQEPTAAASSQVESVALKLNPGSSGFGEYLVLVGIINRVQLYKVLQLHHTRRYRLGAAVVKLGYASPEKIESLARRYHRVISEPGAPAVAVA